MNYLPASITVITEAEQAGHVLRNERVVGVHFSGAPMPAWHGATINGVINWLIGHGYRPAQTRPNGMAVWQEQPGEHHRQVRRQATFVQ